MKGDLKKAAKLYRRSKFTQVIRLLEPQIFRYRQNYDFFYLAGMSCLNTGDLGGASTYLQRGLGLKPNDSKANLGLAMVFLKRQDIQEAIRCYLEILDSDPGNKIAARSLALLQKNASPEQVHDLIESGRLERLLPDYRRRRAPVFITAASLLILAAAVFLFFKYAGVVGDKQALRNPSVEMMSLDDISAVVDFSGEYRYVLTEKEIEKTFSAVKDHFSRFRDNLCRREINRLLGSNASLAVKEQARTIAGYIPVPNFTTITDPFDYDSVAADPFLHSDTYINWAGKLSNLVIGDDLITFDLLVGYEKNQLLLGIVPVELDFAVSLSDGDAVEVLGRIKLTDTEDFFLDAVSIHKIVPKEGG